MSLRPQLTYEETPVYLEGYPATPIERSKKRKLEEVEFKRLLDRMLPEVTERSIKEQNDEIAKGALLFAGSTFLLGVIVGLIASKWILHP